MEIAAHTKGGYDGVPQSVGREFVKADAGLGGAGKRQSAPGATNGAHVSHEELRAHADRVNAAHGAKGPSAPGSHD